jgi:hypothetical protein
MTAQSPTHQKINMKGRIMIDLECMKKELGEKILMFT